MSKPSTSPTVITPTGSSISTLSVPPRLTSDRYLMPTAEIYPSKATMSRRTSSDTQSPTQSETSPSASSRSPSIANGYAGGKIRLEVEQKPQKDERGRAAATPATSTAIQDDLDVQSVINERRPSKLRTTHDGASTSASIASDQYSAVIRGEGYSHIYVATDDKSDEAASPCGNASESTGSLSAVASLSVAGSICGVGNISVIGSMSSGSNGSRNGGSGNGSIGGVHIGEGGAIGSDVRIYVDDTDSASSSNGHRRGGRLRDDETLDTSTTISSTTTMRNGAGRGGAGGNGGGSGGGSGGTDKSKETSERPSTASGPPDDPS